ncbi:glycerophosphodiester phosphodiesterase family protein [Pseudochelatococcus lubricantis]|uniref:glycerophosphodiester phosphodiesterase family protein n=1 Tax=Pseudochelatococcus lubricantis TaxID=1538102 RepID=UPI0035E7CDE6
MTDTGVREEGVIYSGAFNFAFVRYDQNTVDAGYISAQQTADGSDGNNVTIALKRNTYWFALDHGRIDNSNRGDYHIRAGSATNDAINGIFVASIASNGVDWGFGDGVQYGAASIGYRSDNSLFVSVNEAPTGNEFNSDISAAYFDFSRFTGAWVRNGGNTVVSSAGFADKAEVSRNSDYTYTVTLDGVNSLTDGILLVTGGANKGVYTAARPKEDGSGWVIGTHNNTHNGYVYDNEDFGFTYIPTGHKDVTFGRVLSDGSSSVSNGNYNIVKLGTGEYKLTINGLTPKDGALVLSPEGLDGANIDNIVSYQEVEDGWIIQTRDIPSMQLEDAGETVHPDRFADLIGDVNPDYVNAPIDRIIDSYQDAKDGNTLIAAHRAGYYEDGARILPENSLKAIEHAISLGVDIIETDIQRTADGHYVLMHDGSVNRTTTGTGNVSSLTLEQIKSLNLVIEGTREVTDQKVLTIEELFAAIDDKVMVNLDKVSVANIPAIARLGEAAGVADQLLFKAAITNDASLAAVKAALDASPAGIHFMPIMYPGVSAAFVEKVFSTIPVDAVEINVYASGPGQVEDPGYFFMPEIKALFEQYDVRYFMNTLFQGSGNSSGSMSGNRGDFLGLERPDLVYGFWADQGVSIIQTDEPRIAINYLNENGYRLPLAVLGYDLADNEFGGQDIFLHDADALVSDLGTDAIDRVFYDGEKATVVLPDNIEQGTLLDAAKDSSLFGGAGDNTLAGNAFDNVIRGGAGRDVMTGGKGADTFLFDAADQSGARQIDLVTDFNIGEGDKLAFDGLGVHQQASGRGTSQAFTNGVLTNTISNMLSSLTNDVALATTYVASVMGQNSVAAFRFDDNWYVVQTGDRTGNINGLSNALTMLNPTGLRTVSNMAEGNLSIENVVELDLVGTTAIRELGQIVGYDLVG